MTKIETAMKVAKYINLLQNSNPIIQNYLIRAFSRSMEDYARTNPNVQNFINYFTSVNINTQQGMNDYCNLFIRGNDDSDKMLNTIL
jgi:hypothetical protein